MNTLRLIIAMNRKEDHYLFGSPQQVITKIVIMEVTNYDIFMSQPNKNPLRLDAVNAYLTLRLGATSVRSSI